VSGPLAQGAYVLWDAELAEPHVRVGYLWMCRASHERAALLQGYPEGHEWRARLVVRAVDAEQAERLGLRVAGEPVPARPSDLALAQGRARRRAA